MQHATGRCGKQAAEQPSKTIQGLQDSSLFGLCSHDFAIAHICSKVGKL